MPGSTTELPDVDVKSLDSLEGFFSPLLEDPPKLQALQNDGEEIPFKEKKKTSQVVLVKFGG